MIKISLICLLGMILFSGCAVKVDYTGQSFPALSENAEIKFFNSRQEFSLDEYAIIGRMIITAPRRSDFYTFKKAMVEKARSCGGDAVCLVEVDKVSSGVYDGIHEEHGAVEKDTTVPAVDSSQLGKPEKLIGEHTLVVRRRAKVLVLKDRKMVNKMLQ